MSLHTSFINSVLAGAAISLGGIAYLSADNRILGAFLFCIGLFAVCTFELNLFTGKVCYIFNNKPVYTLWVLAIWLGNLIGTVLTGLAICLTRQGPALKEAAIQVCEAKLSDSLLSVFILAVFCNIIIYFAVEGFKSNPHQLGKYFGIALCIMVFILSGYEHCIANMFYFTVAGVWSGKAVFYLAVITLGNACGGVIIPLCKKLNETKKDKTPVTSI